MLGIVPRSGAVVNFSIVRSFRDLASCGLVCEGSEPGHRDGWGMVAWQSGKPVYLGREPNDAATDPLFEEACERGESSQLSSPLLAHLRKASVGLKVVDNTHPFTQDEWAFAHNGTIRRLNLKYTTDSQWFFNSLIFDYKRNGRDIIGSIVKNVKLVREIYLYTSLTFLLSNGIEFYAYRDCTANVDFYTLYYAMTADGMLISQEKFIDV